MDGPNEVVEIPLNDAVPAQQANAEENASPVTEPAGAAAAAAVPASVAEPSLLSYVLSVVSQQLLEELGQAKSTESEENAAIVRELEKLRLDCVTLEELITPLASSYGLLHGALAGFSEQLYQLAIKEEDKNLRTNLMASGLLGRGVAKELSVQAQLNACASSIHQQVIAIQDARETREVYRVARLAFDKAERTLNDAKKAKKANTEVLEVEREAAHKRYLELAEIMKSKVMMLHQFRIRTLAKQLEDMRVVFFQAWSNAAAKIVPSAHAQPDAHSAAIEEFLVGGSTGSSAQNV